MSVRQVCLGDLIEPAKTIKAGSRDYPLLSMTMAGGLVDPATKFKKRVASEDTSGYKVVARGQLVVGFPIDEGVLSFQTLHDEAIVSPAYGIWDLGPKTPVDPVYLEKFLKSPQAIAYYLGKLRSTTARRRSLDRGSFLALPVPLPPLEEQKRIAGILDQAAELCRLRTRALDKLNTLGQAIFHEMFGDQSCREEMVKNLGRVQTGATPSTTVPEYFDGDIPFVTPGDLESDRLPARHLSPEGAKMSRTVSAGATLVCCIGATIGKVGMSTELSAFNQQINAIEWSNQVLPAFGYFAMQQIKPEIIHRGKGAATTLPILKKSEFEKLKVRVANLDHQQIFVDRIGAIGPLVTKADVALRSSETLFAALQHRAFRGKLGNV